MAKKSKLTAAKAIADQKIPLSVIDNLGHQIDFAYGIEAAISGVESASQSDAYVTGVHELIDRHIEMLQEIKRELEALQ